LHARAREQFGERRQLEAAQHGFSGFARPEKVGYE
jgi:hypothetical protein